MVSPQGMMRCAKGDLMGMKAGRFYLTVKAILASAVFPARSVATTRRL
jgi:hypothetical protein